MKKILALIVTVNLLSTQSIQSSIKFIIKDSVGEYEKKLHRKKGDKHHLIYYDELINLININPKGVSTAQDLITTLDISAFDSGKPNYQSKIHKIKMHLMRLAIKHNAKHLVTVLAENGAPLNPTHIRSVEEDMLLFLAAETDLGERKAQKMAKHLIELGAENSTNFDHFCKYNKSNPVCAFVDKVLKGEIELEKYQPPHRTNNNPKQ